MPSRDFCVALLQETGVMFTPGSDRGIEAGPRSSIWIPREAVASLANKPMPLPDFMNIGLPAAGSGCVVCLLRCREREIIAGSAFEAAAAISLIESSHGRRASARSESLEAIL